MTPVVGIGFGPGASPASVVTLGFSIGAAATPVRNIAMRWSAAYPVSLPWSADSPLPVAWSVTFSIALPWGTDMAERTNVTFFILEDLLFTLTATGATAIAGWHFSLKVWATNANKETVAPVLTVTTGFTVTDAVNGVFTLSLPATTHNLAASEYQYEIRRTDSGSNTMLAYGVMDVQS